MKQKLFQISLESLPVENYAEEGLKDTIKDLFSQSLKQDTVSAIIRHADTVQMVFGDKSKIEAFKPRIDKEASASFIHRDGKLVSNLSQAISMDALNLSKATDVFKAINTDIGKLKDNNKLEVSTIKYAFGNLAPVEFLGGVNIGLSNGTGYQSFDNARETEGYTTHSVLGWFLVGLIIPLPATAPIFAVLAAAKNETNRKEAEKKMGTAYRKVLEAPYEFSSTKNYAKELLDLAQEIKKFFDTNQAHKSSEDEGTREVLRAGRKLANIIVQVSASAADFVK